MGEEAFKKKRVGRKTCNAEGRDNGRGAWNGDDRYLIFDGQSDEAKPRVGYAGCTGIGDQGNLIALFQSEENEFSFL